MKIREDFVRPRSDRENAARRAAILDAAESLVLESHNQRFSISGVAERVGVSQSTIFLHFRNREELLAALYTRFSKNFFENFLGRLQDGMSDQAFCEAFIDAAVAHPGFRLMRVMVVRAVSESLNQDFIRDAVKELLLHRAAAAERVAEVLKIEPDQGRRLLRSFVNLMSGAGQTDIGRLLLHEGMEEEVAKGVRTFDIRESFLIGAELLMKGIRQV